jgi:hypothetical protein
VIPDVEEDRYIAVQAMTSPLSPFKLLLWLWYPILERWRVMLQIHYILAHVAYGTSIGSGRVVTGLNYETEHGDPITTRFPYNLSLGGGRGEK